MSCDCYCSVSLPHGAVVCSVCFLQCVIVVFPDHTHLLFYDSYLGNGEKRNASNLGYRGRERSNKIEVQ